MIQKRACATWLAANPCLRVQTQQQKGGGCHTFERYTRLNQTSMQRQGSLLSGRWCAHAHHAHKGRGGQNREIFCVTATGASTMHSSVTIGGGMTTGANNHLSSHRCASTAACLFNSSTPLLLLCEQPSALPFPNLEPSPAHHPAQSIHNAHLGIKNATTPLVMVLSAIGIAPTNSD